MQTTLVGLGQMGDGIARTLLGRDVALTVWNRSPGRAEPLAALGARVAPSLADAVRDADIVLTILADDAAVSSVVTQGLAEALRPGAIHVSLSTVSVALVDELDARHRARGQGFLAAPVFGRPAAAASGQLLVVVAGPEDTIATARPVLDAIGRGVEVIGPKPSQASALKLTGNFLIAALIESLGEAFAFARRHDLDPARVLEVINGGLFKSPVYDVYGGLIAREQYRPAGFALPLGLKDVRLVQQAADAAGVPLPLASLLHDRLLAALGRGKADLDWSALAQVIAEDAGLPPVQAG